MTNNFQIKTLNPSKLERIPWFRNPSWPSLPTIVSTDSKIAGVISVFNTGSSDSNIIALLCANDYTVNWGDGNITNHTANTTASHLYDYANTTLIDSAVTFQTTANTVTKSTHNYSDGMPISFASIITTTGITANINYYVINSTVNTFQLSLTPGGAPITLTNNGTGAILSYKTAVVIITPQVGNTLTKVEFNHNNDIAGAGSQTAWLDLAISSPDMTSMNVGGRYSTRNLYLLEQLSIINGGITPLSNLVGGMPHLKSVPIINSSTTNLSWTQLFADDYALEYVGIIKCTTLPTDVSYMFANCYSLRIAPMINTSNCTTFDYMFAECRSLLKVPNYKIPTTGTTTMQNMFADCSSLVTAPQIKPNGNCTGMFGGCSSLVNVTINTSLVTVASSMFYNCTSLHEASFDLSNVQYTDYMFFNCAALRQFTGKLYMPNNVNANSMFNQCYSLSYCAPITFKNVGMVTIQSMFTNAWNLKIPPVITNFDASRFSINQMFYLCVSMIETPTWDLTNYDSNGFISNCYNLVKSTLITNHNISYNSCNLSSITINNLLSALSYPLTPGTSYFQLSGNRVIYKSDFLTCAAHSYTAIGYYSNLSNCIGYMLSPTRTSSPLATPSTVSVSVSTSTFTLVGHNLQLGKKISFKTIDGSISGVSLYTTYYIINVTTDTFQISLTSGGPPVILDGLVDGSATIIWGSKLVSASLIAGVWNYTFDSPFPTALNFIYSDLCAVDTIDPTLNGWVINY